LGGSLLARCLAVPAVVEGLVIALTRRLGSCSQRFHCFTQQTARAFFAGAVDPKAMQAVVDAAD
jgi:hypothetical protein